MDITSYTVEEIKDPTGIIEGKRVEFLLDIEVDEEDELYTENGLELRVILSSTEQGDRIVQHYFINKSTRQVLEFALDEDEEAEVLEFCRTHMDVQDEGLL